MHRQPHSFGDGIASSRSSASVNPNNNSGNRRLLMPPTSPTAPGGGLVELLPPAAEDGSPCFTKRQTTGHRATQSQQPSKLNASGTSFPASASHSQQKLTTPDGSFEPGSFRSRRERGQARRRLLSPSAMRASTSDTALPATSNVLDLFARAKIVPLHTEELALPCDTPIPPIGRHHHNEDCHTHRGGGGLGSLSTTPSKTLNSKTNANGRSGRHMRTSYGRAAAAGIRDRLQSDDVPYSGLDNKAEDETAVVGLSSSAIRDWGSTPMVDIGPLLAVACLRIAEECERLTWCCGNNTSLMLRPSGAAALEASTSPAAGHSTSRDPRLDTCGSGIAVSTTSFQSARASCPSQSSRVVPQRGDSDTTRDDAKAVEALVVELARTVQYRGAGPLVVVASMMYLGRIASKAPRDTRYQITRSNWYGVVVVCMLIATKMYIEEHHGTMNKKFSEASGIGLHELCRLEVQMLYLIDFDLFIEEEDVAKWCDWMLLLALRHGMRSPLESFLGTAAHQRTASGSASAVPGSSYQWSPVNSNVEALTSPMSQSFDISMNGYPMATTSSLQYGNHGTSAARAQTPQSLTQFASPFPFSHTQSQGAASSSLKECNHHTCGCSEAVPKTTLFSVIYGTDEWLEDADEGRDGSLPPPGPPMHDNSPLLRFQMRRHDSSDDDVMRDFMRVTRAAAQRRRDLSPPRPPAMMSSPLDPPSPYAMTGAARFLRPTPALIDDLRPHTHTDRNDEEDRDASLWSRHCRRVVEDCEPSRDTLRGAYSGPPIQHVTQVSSGAHDYPLHYDFVI